MPTLKDVIEKHDTREGKIFDLFIQGLIVLSLITFAISTSPKVSPEGMRALRIIEIITVAIFTVEYILRIIVADNKFKYIFSFFGIIDLLAIVPFYISIGLDLRALRSFRLIRLFSMFKLTRYSSAMNRFRLALGYAREEIILFLLFTMILLFISAIGIYYFENPAQPDVYSSMFDSLWWAVTTLTTVGYGDMYPITAGGRLFTFVVLMIGLGVIAVPTGMLATALAKAREHEAREKEAKQGLKEQKKTDSTV
jgi:voltage-gated potassium channel